MAELILPTERRAPAAVNPRVLLIYSKPKAGKTSVLSGLDGNLIVDLDPLGGTDFLSALSVKASSIEDLRSLSTALWAVDPFPYKYITLDPLTDLETIVLPLACEIYQSAPMGRGWTPYDAKRKRTDYSMILSLPNGAGYYYLRKAFMQVMDNFAAICKAKGARLILSAHIQDKSIQKNGKEVESADVNLTGKIRSMACAWVDAIGFLSRRENETYLVFRTSDEVLCGSRSPHLRGKEILLSRSTGEAEDLVIETFWDSIFVPEAI